MGNDPRQLGNGMESSRAPLEGTQVKRFHLGMPGAWAIDKFEPSDHYTTKIGGLPDLPAPLQDSFSSGSVLKCPVCNGSLALVAQVNAPLATQGVQYDERTLYVFGCPARGCGADPTCWRTFRVQKGSSERDTLPQDDVATQATKTHAIVPEFCADQQGEQSLSSGWNDCDSWGGEECDEGTGIALDANGCSDLEDLESSLINAGRLAAENSRKEAVQSNREDWTRDIDNGGETQRQFKSIDLNSSEAEISLPTLPCFYVYFKVENIKQRRTDGGPSSSATSSTGASSSSASLKEGRESLINSDADIADHAGEAWEEDYEADRALHAGQTYLKFKKYLDQHPELCLRYAFDAQALWGVDDELVEGPGKCRACGGARVFEMQLMPPVLYFLHQATASESDEGLLSLDAWNWFSLVVFSCARSCTPLNGKDEWNIVEEGTVLQQE